MIKVDSQKEEEKEEPAHDADVEKMAATEVIEPKETEGHMKEAIVNVPSDTNPPPEKHHTDHDGEAVVSETPSAEKPIKEPVQDHHEPEDTSADVDVDDTPKSPPKEDIAEPIIEESTQVESKSDDSVSKPEEKEDSIEAEDAIVGENEPFDEQEFMN